MTIKENAIRVLKEWSERDLPFIISRDIPYRNMINLKHCIGLVGIRRGGKTFTMFQIIKELRKNIPKENIIYINFEERLLQPLDEATIDNVYQAFIENFDFNKSKKLYFFLDEVQIVPSWERVVRNLYDKNNIKFFISGSSSRLLKSELSTLLTGRIVGVKIYPFSFREFLIAKGYENELKDKLLFYSSKIHEIKKLFKTYFEFGGFPEVCLEKNQETRITLLKEYLDGIISRDVLTRFEVKNKVLFENFVNYLFSCVSSLFSFSKAYNFFKGTGQKVSKQALINYFSYLNQVFLFSSIYIYSKKVKDRIKYPVKIYCIDNGFINIAIPKFSKNLGKLAENLVFVHLKRKFSRDLKTEIFYWRSKKNEEVDFIIKQGLKVRQLIQVCLNMDDAETKKREIKSLLEAMNEFKLKEGLIITEDLENEEKFGTKIIKYIPLWKWVIEF